MAWSLVAAVSGGNGGESSSSTSAIDTTGANLLVMVVHDLAGESGVSDSYSNTWTLAVGDSSIVRIFYVEGPIVGSGHTFTIGPRYAGASVAAYAGAASSSVLDSVTNGTSGGGSSIQPGSITPTGDGYLVVTGMRYGDDTDAADIDSGFTISSQCLIAGGQRFGGGQAYLVQSTAAAVNPTWGTGTSDTYYSASICAFLPGAGGVTENLYTELEWSIGVQDPAEDGEIYQFRVFYDDDDTALDSYGVTPQLTIGTGGTTAQSLTLPHIASTTTLHTPTITRGSVTVTLPHIASTTVLYTPTITRGAVTVTIPRITSTTVLYTPTITRGPVTVALPHIASTTTLFTPTITRGPVTVVLPTIASTTVLYAPALALEDSLALPHIPSTTILYPPTVSLAVANYLAYIGTTQITGLYLGTVPVDPSELLVGAM